MDVTEWLRSLGLEQYAPTFEQNHIGPELLPGLTADDLKELGIVSFGHRRAMLRAIAALRSAPAAAADVPAPAAVAASAAERRQLTVMFCDLVGPTALSARLDPEELREVIAAYHRCVAEVARRFDGFVAKYMGDGVLVYFGYPRAHEDDAERSVRAGLDIVTAVGRLDMPSIPGTPTLGGRPSGDQLQVRVGIATGLVVVGDLIGEGEAQERGVVGETPNLAARLQVLAEPGSVVIAPATRRLIGNLFRLRDLGRHEVKGLAEPVEPWAVEGVSVRGPLRSGAERPADRFCRPGVRTWPAHRALEPGTGRRRPGGAALGRAGHRQEPHPRRAARASRGACNKPAPPLLALFRQ
jgi:class 3 adenylate cyclase